MLPGRSGIVSFVILRDWKLLCLLLVLLVLFVPAVTAQAAIDFDWSMPDRFGPDRDGDGLIDYLSTSEIRPASWRVNFNACGNALKYGAFTYRWSVDGSFVGESTRCDAFFYEFPDEGRYSVTLEVPQLPGTLAVTRDVVVQDWLIVSIGDSYASGEGEPDVRITSAAEVVVDLAVCGVSTFDEAWQRLDQMQADIDHHRTVLLVDLLNVLDAARLDLSNVEIRFTNVNAALDAYAATCLPADLLNFDPVACAVATSNMTGALLVAEIADAAAIVAQGIEAVRSTVDAEINAARQVVSDAEQAVSDMESLIDGLVQMREFFGQCVEGVRRSVHLAPVWHDRQCHRSIHSKEAQAALLLERADPRTSVTFVHLACSGATVTEGLLGPYAGPEPPNKDALEECVRQTRLYADTWGGSVFNEIQARMNCCRMHDGCKRPQVDEAKELVGDRAIDALLISIGGNDISFGPIVEGCMFTEPCNQVSGVYPSVGIINGLNRTTGCGMLQLMGLVSDVLNPCRTTSEWVDAFLDGADINAEMHPTSRELFDGAIGDLDSLYRDLNARITVSLGLPGNRIYISEYGDATLDENGAYCDFPGDVARDGDFETAPIGLSPAEAQWAGEVVTPALNEKVGRNGLTGPGGYGHVWNVIDGLADLYRTYNGLPHGYCSSDPWFVRLGQSLEREGGILGTMHPTKEANATVARELIEPKLRTDFYTGGDLAQPRIPARSPLSRSGGPYFVAEGGVIPLQNSSFDPNPGGGSLTYLWTIVSSIRGGQVSLNNPTLAMPILTAVEDGEVVLALRATNGSGASGTSTTTVTVTNTEPVVSVTGPLKLYVGTPANLAVSISDAGSLDSHDLMIDWGDGSPLEERENIGSPLTVSHIYSVVGMHEISVIVLDDEGGAGKKRLTMVVDEHPFNIDNDGDGFREIDGDCDDADKEISPGRSEACDRRDNNCDGLVDEGACSRYTITATAGSDGRIAPEGAVPVDRGDSMRFIFYPDEGVKVSDVVVDGVSVGNVAAYTFTNVELNHVISVGFVVHQAVLHVPSASYLTIQSAVDAAVDGDTVVVADGIYGGAGNCFLRTRNKSILLRSENGPERTVIDCPGNSRGFFIVDGEGPKTVIAGFSVTGVQSTGSGGGVYVSDSSPTFVNMIFRGNRAVEGAGAYLYRSNAEFINCVFNGNDAGTGNGGGVYVYQGAPAFRNNTFSANNAKLGTGVYVIYANPVIVNSILWDNALNEVTLSGAAVDISYSILRGFSGGIGNIALDPLFLDADGADNTPGTADDDLRLSGGSPALDRGINAGLPSDSADLNGDGDTNDPLPRDIGGRPRRLDDPFAADAGSGSAPLVDMGAYERNRVIYVDVDVAGANNGASWFNAFRSIQDALDAAGTNDEIWVAEGIYRPDTGAGRTSGDRTESFGIRDRVSLYGGFEGTETQRAQRNALLHPVVLSGDLAGDDGPDFSGNGDNSYHVLRTLGPVAPETIVDGFTITGGNGDGPGSNGQGGGFFTNSSPTLANCRFIGNTAVQGGALYLTAAASVSDPRVVNCEFFGNQAMFGGAVLADVDSGPAFINSLFSGNGAQWGGGLYANQSRPAVSSSTFAGNSGTLGGGGIVIDSAPSPLNLTNSIFWTNTGPQGPQIVINGAMTLTVDYSAVEGGAAAVANSGATFVWGTHNEEKYPILFTDADGLDDIVGTADDDLRLGPGSGGDSNGDSTALPADIADLDRDGNTTEVLPLDLDFRPRVYANLEMGAYENGGITIYVDGTARGRGDGSSWTDAMTSLQDALAMALSGDSLLVAEGLYRPDEGVGIARGDRNASFKLRDGVSVRGGFPAGPSTPKVQDRVAHPTILSGDLLGDDGPDYSNMDENSYHVVVAYGVGSDTYLEGFIIRGGHANPSSGYPATGGAGMYNQNASPTIRGCVFENNLADVRGGGGMLNHGNANPSIHDSIFRDNSAGPKNGGAMYNAYDSRPVLINSVFVNNTALEGGAMVNVYNSDIVIENGTFSRNRASVKGGAIRSWNGCDLTISNSIFWADISPLGSEISLEFSNALLRYSILQGASSAVDITNGNGNVTWDAGSLDTDPRFADASLHLLPLSPAVDAGDPASVYSREPFPNGGRINMGVYGNTVGAAVSDGDGDGIFDKIDNCPNQSNMDQVDADADGIGDVCDWCPGDTLNDQDEDGVCASMDNCPNLSNPNQRDLDRDGLGDSCDICPRHAANDVDGDGVCENVDNCPTVDNEFQVDADNDGLGDACDPCPTDILNDTDGDGVCGAQDNCPDTANAFQSDGDGDGAGDACDPCPADAGNDADADGLCKNSDNCPLVPNPAQTDLDADSLGDACDPCLSDPGDTCNTQAGDGAVLAGLGGAVSVAFGEVIAGGETTLQSVSCAVVSGINTILSPGCVDIRSTALWNGLVEICIDYDESALAAASEPFVSMTVCGADRCVFPVTVRLDTVSNRICGDVDYLGVAAAGLPADTDGDAVPDLADNCPGQVNPDQADSDMDTHGDVCDSCPATLPGSHTNVNGCVESQLDDDDDGFTNGAERSAYTDPNNADSMPGQTALRLRKGFNLLSFPADTSRYGSVKTWLESMGGAAAIETVRLYHAVTGDFETFGFDSGGNFLGTDRDVTQTDALGLVVRARRDLVLRFNSVYCPSWNLRSGVNLVGSPCGAGRPASGLLLELSGLGATSAMQAFDRETGKFLTLDADAGKAAGSEFTLEEGVGYFLYVDRDISGYRP